MDAARYAGMSDPDLNPNFNRRWLGPPLKRNRPLTGGTVMRAGYDFEALSKGIDKETEGLLQLVFGRSSE